MIELLSGLSIAAAILLAALALRPGGRDLAADRIAELKRGDRNGGGTVTDAVSFPTDDRRLDSQVQRWVPASTLGKIRRSLAAAGDPVTVTEFVIAAAVVGAAIGAIPLVLALASGASPVSALLFGGIGLLAGAFGLPTLWLKRRIRERRLQIWRSLPDAADLLTTCVEAGLDVNASFARVALEMPGPFQEEVRIMLREVSLGRRRRDALSDIGERTGVDDLSGMLTAIIQAEESGTALAGVLRAQSRHIRASRRLFAEQRARVVPAKMTFPIIFLIVPTLFILILGPVAIDIMETFSL